MSLTKTGVIIGSPLYMSPEQMRSTKDADARSDIWSLGAILFQLVTGRPPYMGETIPELCSQLFSSDAPPASTVSVTQGLPPALDAVVARSLARDPARRYQSVAEFGEALLDFALPQSRVHVDRARRVLSSEADAPASVFPSAGRPHAAAPTIIEASVSNAAPARTTARPRNRKLAAVLVALGVVIGVVVLAMQRTSESGAAEGTAVASPGVPAAEPVKSPTLPVTAEEPPSPTPVDASAAPEGLPSAVSVSPHAPRVRPMPPTAAPVRKPAGTGAAAKPAAGGVSDFGGRR
jgi:serine/threonine-protein kinase